MLLENGKEGANSLLHSSSTIPGNLKLWQFIKQDELGSQKTQISSTGIINMVS